MFLVAVFTLCALALQAVAPSTADAVAHYVAGIVAAGVAQAVKEVAGKDAAGRARVRGLKALGIVAAASLLLGAGAAYYTGELQSAGDAAKAAAAVLGAATVAFRVLKAATDGAAA